MAHPLMSDIARPTVRNRLASGARSPAVGLVAAALLWVLLVLNFNALSLLGGDATRPFSFVRRLFRESGDAVGYQFGLAFFEAPSYGLGKVLRALGVESLAGKPIAPALISLGTSVYVLIAGAVAVVLLGLLRLPGRGTAVAVAVVGSPLVFYGLFSTGQSHAVDALLFTIVVGLTYPLSTRRRALRLAVAVGAVIGVSASVRYFACFEAAALALGLCAYRRKLEAVLVVAATGAVFGALALVPTALGVPLNSGYDIPVGSAVVFAPLNPLRMLFTDHRGLFVWSPATALGAIGYLRLLRTRGGADRRFLVLVGGMALAIVLSCALVSFWDGTWSFSQRYYTPLFSVVAIGVGGLLEWRPAPVRLAAAAAVAWSLLLVFNLQTLGPPKGDYSNVDGGATDVAVEVRFTTPGAYAWGIYHLSNVRRLLPRAP